MLGPGLFCVLPPAGIDLPDLPEHSPASVVADRVPTRALVLRTSPMFVLSFFWAGAQHILPQLYLLTHAPEDKAAVLAALLGLGTACAALGVALSRRRVARPVPLGLSSLLGWLLATLITFSALVLPVEPLAAFVVAYGAFRLVSNVLYNHLDCALLAAARGGAARHATAVAVWQIAGQTVGPAAFVALAGHQAATLLAVVVLGAGALAALSRLRGAFGASPPPAPGHDAALSSRARRLLAYTFLLQTGVVGLLGNMIFLLKDWVRVDAPEQAAGALISGMGVLSAVVAVRSRRVMASQPSPWSVVWPALLLAVTPAILLARPGVPGLVLAALAAGIGGGRYLVGTRQLASMWTEAPGPAALLGRYNNVANVASLTGYALSGGVALILGEGHLAYVYALLGMFGALFLAAAALAGLRPFTADPPSAPAPG